MQKEGSLLKKILVHYTKKYGRLFRQNVGTGYIGKTERYPDMRSVLVYPGDIVIRNARPLQAGLCKGSSDLIGLTPLQITSDMIGKIVPVFTAFEVKTGKLKATKEQKYFIDFVKSMGGLSSVVYSIEDIEGEIQLWKKTLTK